MQLLRGTQLFMQRKQHFVRSTLVTYERYVNCGQFQYQQHNKVHGQRYTAQQQLVAACDVAAEWQRLGVVRLLRREYCSGSSIGKKHQQTIEIKSKETQNEVSNQQAAVASQQITQTAAVTTPPTKAVTITTTTATATPGGVVQTKSFELKTSKGILSISTTIEDSKINDIVFEKTDVVPPPDVAAKLNEPALESTNTEKVASMTAATTETPVATLAQELPLPTTPPKPPTVTSSETATKLKLPKFLQITKKEPESAKVDVPVVQQPNVSATSTTAEILKPKPRPRFDCNRSSLERNFITPSRAMSDFLLKASDLEGLPKIKRRSPYEQEPPITVYWRRDVEAKAIAVWGSRENLIKECLKREVERKQYQQNIFTIKRRLRDYRREIGSRAKVICDEQEQGLSGKSGKVVLTAIAINGANFLFKLGGWLYSGSHSMFAECIHSLADLLNQAILAFGIHKSMQSADFDHPYGYSNMKYVSALISGVGIFCMGCGLSMYHGIVGILTPEPVEDLFWAYFILSGSFLSEGATLMVALNQLRRAACESNMSFKDYLFSGRDPCVNVVLAEDAAAVTGVLVAASCMGLSTLTNSPIYDSVGSLLIGGILGGIASFIIYTNTKSLVGRTIRPERLEKINAALEADVMIRAIHDIKGVDIGNSLVRYKAELDFDGRELTRSYLDKHDLNELLAIVKSFRSVEELEIFLLDHGENIVDLMGGEIDRIEMNLRNQFPEIRHCDLEVL